MNEDVMGRKVSVQELAAMLALSTGKGSELCASFLKELFAVVAEELSGGENVRIKGFGTFKLVEVEPRKSVNVATGEEFEIPGHVKVIFVASKELASVVNEPFEVFETVEIADELASGALEGDVDIEHYEKVLEKHDEPLNDFGSGNGTLPQDSPEEESSDAEGDGEDLPDDGIKTLSDNENLFESAAVLEAVPDSSADSDPDSALDSDIGSAIMEKDEMDDSDSEIAAGRDDAPSLWRRYRFLLGFTAGMIAAVVIGWVAFGVGDYLRHKDSGKSEESVDAIVSEADVVAPEETASLNVLPDTIAVPTAASDEIVYDTVTTTRYLTTMAKDHYGNFNLWPLIYEENAAILGHPDRIKPGTRVVVPPLSKFGIDPYDADQVKAVKRKGTEIYSRYK